MNLWASVEVGREDFHLSIELNVAAGETVALLGPNGAGKTTLVEALAGILPITRGETRIGDLIWEAPEEGIRLPPQQRSVGVMFQGLLLFPALTAVDNVAFGLRAHGASRDEARTRAREVMAQFGIADLASQKPSGLSGGEAQRVALARALVVEPDLLLLDEPMSALDVASRAESRRHLKSVLSTFEGMKLIVTHEPFEAMMLADRLVIVERGSLVQEGTPAEIRSRPKSAYVASLVGVNLLSGVIVEGDGHRILETKHGSLIVGGGVRPGQEALASIHPRAVALFVEPSPRTSARNVWEMRVAGVEPMGERARVVLEGRPPLTAEVTAEAVQELNLRPGQTVWAAVKATQIDVYPA